MTVKKWANPLTRSGDFIIISSRLLMQGAKGNAVDAFATYKQSQGWKSTVYTIEELSDQFAYGLDGHPQAVRDFINYTAASWSKSDNRHVFLIGKGLDYTKVKDQQKAAHFYSNLWISCFRCFIGR